VSDDSVVTSGVLIAAAIAQLVTFLGVVAGLLFNYIRDGRTRKWLKEDRDYLAHETAATAANLASHTADVAAKLASDRADLAAQAVATAKALADHTTDVGGDLKSMAIARADAVQVTLDGIADDVKATKLAAGDAYKEANHVNLKLEALGLARVNADKATDLATLVRETIAMELDRRLTPATGTPVKVGQVDKPDH